MHPRVIRRLTALLAGLGIVACDTSTEPETQRLISLALDFCSNETPVWFAYQNEDDSWTRLVADAEGTFRFTALNHVAIAFVRRDGADYATEIVFAANTELEQLSGLACLEAGGTKSVNGTVAGVTAGHSSLVSMNFSTVLLSQAQTSFTLTQLAERPLDVIAGRVTSTSSSFTTDRVILRRNRNFVTTATMPVLDFAAAEAFAPATFTVSTSGVLSGETGFIANYFYSQLETSQAMSYVDVLSNGSLPMVGIPAAELAAGDYHDLYAVAVAADGGTRGMERYFAAPPSQTAIALGPPLATPTVTTVASTPYLRPRGQAPRQLDYDRAFAITYTQQSSQFASTIVSVTVTSGYDASGTWSATVPDLSPVSGWQNAWGLTSGGLDWTAVAYGGRVELLFGAKPADGEWIRFAGRSSSASLSRMSVRKPMRIRG